MKKIYFIKSNLVKKSTVHSVIKVTWRYICN